MLLLVSMIRSQFPSTLAWLVAGIEQFLKNNPRVSAKNFGWQVARDTKFVDRLRNGGDVTTTMMDTILNFISTQSQGEVSHGKESKVSGEAQKGKSQKGKKAEGKATRNRA